MMVWLTTQYIKNWYIAGVALLGIVFMDLALHFGLEQLFVIGGFLLLVSVLTAGIKAIATLISKYF